MKRIFFLSLISGILMSCGSSMTVNQDYDRSTDFSKYKTFQLLPWAEEAKTLVQRNSVELINQAIISELTQKGYTYVEKGADLVVSPFVHIDEKEGTTAYTNYYGAGGYGYYGGFGYGMGTATTTYNNYTYEVGSLILDVYDQKEKKLIWQAIGSTEISDNPKKVQAKIPSYVRQVLWDYPKQGTSK